MAASKRTGGRRMCELGYFPIQIWLDVSEYRTLKEMAKAEERPMTQVMLRLLRAAERRLLRRKLPLFERN